MKSNIFNKMLLLSISIMFFSFHFNFVVKAKTIVKSGICGDNLTWTLDDEDNLVISGIGKMYDYTEGKAPWQEGKEWFFYKSIVIDEGVTSIGDYAFWECLGSDNKYLTVTLPVSLKSIGYKSFYGSSIDYVKLSDNITKIGTYAFACTPFLRGFYVDVNNPSYYSDGRALYDKNVTTLYEYASNCNIEYYSVPESVDGLECLSFAGGNWSDISLKYLFISSHNAAASGSTFWGQMINLYCYADSPLYSQISNKWINGDFTLFDLSEYEGKKIITNAEVVFDKESYEYTGDAIEPTIEVKYNGRKLIEGKDYVKTYKYNIDVRGYAYVIITGIGDYICTKHNQFNITPKDISSAEVNIIDDNITYSGKQIEAQVNVKCNTTLLQEGIDYTVSYENNINAGIATAIISGVDNYSGTIRKTFNISPCVISEWEVRLGSYDSVYDGNEKTPEITVKSEKVWVWHEVDGTNYGEQYTLIEGTDYTCEYNNNINVGNAEVIIKGKDNFCGSIKKTFYVIEKKNSDTNINISEKESATIVKENNNNAIKTNTPNDNYFGLEDDSFSKRDIKNLKLKKSKITLCGGCKGEIEIKSSEGDVSYKSNNTSIATVSKYGVVKAKKKGNVDIVVTDDETGQQCICKVKVNEKINKKVISKKIKQLKRKYPEGKKWSDKTRDRYGNTGCYAYMTKVTEYLYGVDASSKTHCSFKKIKVGDHIRISDLPHSVIVIEKRKNSVIVTEGNYASSVHWGREITKSYLSRKDYYVETWY